MSKKKEEVKAPVQNAKPVLVNLGHPDENASIYFTTDGTYPVPNKAQKYIKPFFVHKNTTIKAVAVVGEDVSPVLTKEYKVI